MAPLIRRLLFIGSRVTPIRRWVTKDFSYVAAYDPEISEDLIRGTYQSTFDSLLSAAKVDLRPRLSQLSVETLAIGTDRDALISPDQYGLVPAHYRELIPETGHIPMIERPAEFNRILNNFLSHVH